MEFFDRLVKEFPVIRQAPISFAVVLLLLGIGIWLVVRYAYGVQIENLKTQIETQKAQFELLKASIDQQSIALADLRQRESIWAQKSTDTATSAVVATNKPEFKLLMIGGNIFESGKLTGIALTTRVWNIGAPSVATNWSLSVIPHGGQPVKAQLTRIPDGNLSVSGPINSAVIRAADALDEKTKSAFVVDLPTEGTLLFYTTLKRTVVLDKTTRLELSVKDIYEHEFVTTQVMGDWLQR